MSDQTYALDLEKKDLKKLKFHRKVHLFMLAILSVLTIVMLSAGIYFGLIEGELVGAIMLVLGLIFLALAFRFRKQYRDLKSDYSGGVKTAMQGKLEDKSRHRSSCTLRINDQTYPVHIDHYFDYKKGDEVFIAFGPASKMILDIKKQESTN